MSCIKDVGKTRYLPLLYVARSSVFRCHLSVRLQNVFFLRNPQAINHILRPHFVTTIGLLMFKHLFFQFRSPSSLWE